MNDELRQRSLDLDSVNGFLESVLRSLRGGVVVVDNDLRVLVWNGRSTDMWGLREDEVVGKHLLGLDIGLPIGQLRLPLRACLANGDGSGDGSGDGAVPELMLDAVNRRGRPIQCRVTCAPLSGAANAIRGAILLMEEVAPGDATGVAHGSAGAPPQ